MGYYTRLHKVDKKEIKALREMSIEQVKQYLILNSEEYGTAPDDVIASSMPFCKTLNNELICFGKYEEVPLLEKFSRPLFKNEDVQEYFSDYNPRIVDKCVCFSLKDFDFKKYEVLMFGW